MVIAIDFDGTCVKHEFPKVGRDIGAVPVLKKLVEKGHKLVLFTMRSDIVNPQGEDNELHLESGNYLTDALNWFKENDIPLYGVQTNPTQHTWTTSPKAYAKLYIDDAALGCPLLQDYKDVYGSKETETLPVTHISKNLVSEFVGRPYVYWERVADILKDMEIL